MTGDEKWILFNNVEQKRLCSKGNEPPTATPKTDLLQRWCLYGWDWKGVLYYELLPEHQMINYNKYWSQLDQLKTTLKERVWSYLAENAYSSISLTPRLPVSLTTRQKLLTVWLESSDSYNLFIRHCTFRFPLILVFTKFSIRKNFNSLEACKGDLEQFFAQKDKKS